MAIELIHVIEEEEVEVRSDDEEEEGAESADEEEEGGTERTQGEETNFMYQAVSTMCPVEGTLDELDAK